MRSALQTTPWHYVLPALLALAVGSILLLRLPLGEELFLLNAWRIEPYNAFFRAITHLGEWHLWIFLVMLVGRFGARAFVLMLLASIGMMGLNFGLKELVQKERPHNWLKQFPDRAVVWVPNQYVNSAKTSWPSGHTSSAFGVFYLLAQLPQGRRTKAVLGVSLALLAILVGISRVFLMQHFLADVVAGGAIGLAYGSVTWLVLRSFLRR